MTAAQKAAKAKLPPTTAHKTCKARLGADRCRLIEAHPAKWHEAVGPTGVRIRWTRAFVSPIRGFVDA